MKESVGVENEQNVTQAVESQVEQKEGSRLYWIKKIAWIVCKMLIPLFLVVFIAWWHNGDNLIANPPITITVRRGVLSDWVLCVSNDSPSRTLHLSVKFKSGAKESSLRGRLLRSGETAEFGALEMVDWRPKNGDTALVRVAGYARGVRVVMGDDAYSADFEYMNYFIHSDP